MAGSLYQIQQTLKSHFDVFSKDYHVRRFGVFGSYSQGKQTAESDIDVLVELSQPIGLLRFVELEQKLSELFDRKVDLVTPGALKPLVRAEVQKQVLYV